VKKFYIRL